MRTRVGATDHLKLTQLEEQVPQLAPERLHHNPLMTFDPRIVQLHQVANDELVEVDDPLPQFRQRVELLVPTVAAAPQQPRAANDVNAKFVPSTRRTLPPGWRDHLTWVKLLRHISILPSLAPSDSD